MPSAHIYNFAQTFLSFLFLSFSTRAIELYLLISVPTRIRAISIIFSRFLFRKDKKEMHEGTEITVMVASGWRHSLVTEDISGISTSNWTLHINELSLRSSPKWVEVDDRYVRNFYG